MLLTSPLGLKHWYYYQATETIWNWMKKFSRDPANHDLYENGHLIVKATR